MAPWMVNAIYFLLGWGIAAFVY
ncbi:uncharacterized protein METZ01_LOCUS390026 [marine metagenome]|uniref:Uncharacterized protein n=1 Tax=marine metagenome TaxID=408172 RepID=A0A382USJ0_9ZZZZ